MILAAFLLQVHRFAKERSDVMGWTGIPKHFDSASEKKQYLDSLFGDGIKVLISRMVSNEYYAAIQLADGTVTAEVIKTASRSAEFLYKAVSEDCGPIWTKCPQMILEILSPTENQWALKWRQDCADYNEAQRIKRRKYKKTAREKKKNERAQLKAAIAAALV